MTDFQDNRQIRIFISSTFSDMKDERDELMNHVFPRLSYTANQRCVALSAIDLRWGIKPEDARSGRVVEICLKEIEHSHPFFLGIVGNYYGTTAKVEEYWKNKNLQLRHGEWLQQAFEQGLSLTEIEMQFGAFMEMEHPEEGDMPRQRAVFFIDEHERVPEENAEKLKRLRDKIKDYHNKGLCDMFTYSSPKDLGTKVDEYFNDVLTRLYPEDTVDADALEDMEQDAVCRRLARNYVAYGDYVKSLDTFLSDKERPFFVLTGASGQGKSALMAYWINQLQADKKHQVVYYFVGIGNKEGRLDAMLRHIIWSLCKAYGIEREPREDGYLNTELQQLFQRIEGREPVVIVIDGINQLDENNLRITSWLPMLPNNVKMVFTTQNRAQDIQLFDDLTYLPKELKPMSDVKDTEDLIEKYLGDYGKKLDDVQRRRIAESPLCGNNMALRTILDELIVFGIFEKLDERIEYYLSSKDLDELFIQVIERHKEDYGHEIVAGILSLIGASKKGLSEEELICMLGIKQLEWSEFFCSFYRHFNNYEGLLSFSHQHVSQVVIDLYNSEIETNREIIINYFTKEMKKADGTVLPLNQCPRAFTELAYQYYKLGRADELYNLLLDFNIFEYFCRENQMSDLRTYWQFLLQTDPKHYTMDAFLSLSADDKNQAALCYRLLSHFATFIIIQPESANSFLEKALDIDTMLYGELSSEVALDHFCFGRLYASSLYQDYGNTLCHDQKALEILSELKGDYHKELIQVYEQIAVTLCNLNEYNQAKYNLQKIIELIREHPYSGDQQRIADILTKWATVEILHQQSLDAPNYKDAREKLELSLKISTVDSICNSTSAEIYYVLGDVCTLSHCYDEAKQYYDKSIEQYEQLYGSNCPLLSAVYIRLGRMFRMQGMHEMAIEWMQNALKVSESPKATNAFTTVEILMLMGQYYMEWDIKRFRPEAERCFKRTIELYDKAGIESEKLIHAYKNLGSLYLQCGFTPLCESVLKKAYEICLRNDYRVYAKEIALLIDETQNR